MIRCGSNDLRIDKDRGTLEREDRICQFCEMRTIEDEEHFLLRCPIYMEERECMLLKVAKIKGTWHWRLHDDEDLMEQLSASENGEYRNR